MKKIIGLILCATISALAAQAQAQTRVEQSNPIYCENESSDNVLLAYSSDSNSLEILVRASAAVNDVCNYFNGSWLDAGITLYCTFGGDVYTCTAHKVVKAMCSLNGSVRLILEGVDMSIAIKRAIIDSSTVYNLIKIADRSYKLTK